MSVVKLQPLSESPVLKKRVYNALREAIAEMDIYSGDQPPKLDERKLAKDLGVSRTPIREAINCLEQEGLVVTYPRRGAFVVRKTRAEILEIISVWAAIESMAARMASECASDQELVSLREMFASYDNSEEAKAHIDAYSDTNIEFHQRLIQLSKCNLLIEMANGLFIHMKAIRRKTIAERDRTAESIVDHMHIIDALELRDADQSGRLVREHAMHLADHIKRYGNYLE